MTKIIEKIQKTLVATDAVVLAGAIFAGGANSVYAESLGYNVNVGSSLNVTVSTNDLSLDLNPSYNPYDTTDLDISVGTNHPNGYKLYVSSDSADLTNTDYSTTYYINTLTGSTTESAFPANYWGYRISSGTTGDASITDTTGTYFYPYTSGALISSSSTAVNDNSSTLTYAAKVDYEKPAGAYENSFAFTAIANPLTYNITIKTVEGIASVTLDDTTCTSATGCAVTDLTYGVAYDLVATLEDGYSFTSWDPGDYGSVASTSAASTTFTVGEGDTTITPSASVNSYTVTVSNTNTTSGASSISVPYNGSNTVTVTPDSNYYLSDVSCPSGYTCSGYNTGTSYTGTQTVTVTNNGTTSGGTLSFTGTATSQTIATSTYMQDVSSVDDGGCPATLTTGQAYALKDSRDETTYYVARLADGNCWMLQNLKLGLDMSTGSASKTLTSDDSDVNGSFSLTNKLALGSKMPYTTVSGTSYQYNSQAYQCATNGYGCYYNWYTATAGAGVTSVSSGDVNYSICPKGWTLPTRSQFLALYTQYNSATAMLVSPTSSTENTNGASVPGFLLSGYYSSNGAYYVGSYGCYWSRSANSALHAYYLYLNTSSVNPANNNNKYNGLTVRCVLR